MCIYNSIVRPGAGAGAVVMNGICVVNGIPLAVRFGNGTGPQTSRHALPLYVLMMPSAEAGSARCVNGDNICIFVMVDEEDGEESGIFVECLKIK